MESKKESAPLRAPVTICDWGSTNLRAYLVGEDGQVQRKYESKAGSKAMAGDAGAYRDELRKALCELGVEDDAEIRISGMAGSKVGWKETGYASTPLASSGFSSNFCLLDEFPGARLYGGLKHEKEGCFPDVMRGEEIQVIGIMTRCPDVKVICLPGTHSKWVKLEEDLIHSFQTMMTGDLFQALCEKTIFKEQITSQEFHREGFLAGCALAKSGKDLNDLFQLRSAFVFSMVSSDEFYSFLSGFLITNEIQSLADGESEVALCGAPALVSSYALAMMEMGIDATIIHGEDATVRGHLGIFTL